MREKLVTLEQAAKLVRTGDKVIMMGGLDNTPMALLARSSAARPRNSTPSVWWAHP